MLVNMKRSPVLLWAVCVLLSVESHCAALPEGSSSSNPTAQPGNDTETTSPTSPAPLLETHHQNQSPHPEPTPSPTGTPTTITQNTPHKRVSSTVHATAAVTPKTNGSLSAGDEEVIGKSTQVSTVAVSEASPSYHTAVVSEPEKSTGQPSSSQRAVMTSPDPSSTASEVGSSPQLHSPSEHVVTSNASSTNSATPPSLDQGLNSPTGTSVPFSQSSSTDPGTHTKGPSTTAADPRTTEPSSSQTVHSATGPATASSPSTSTPNNPTNGLLSVTDHRTTSGPVGASEASSTSEPQSTTRPPGSPSTSLPSTTGLTSADEPALTSGAITTTSVISTTTNSTNSSEGLLIPITKPPPAAAKTPAPKDHSSEAGIQHCSPHRWDGVVSQCLITIAALAGVATIFMVSTIVLCTKLSARRHCYRVREANPGTEMVCISTLLPERSTPYGRQRNPRSNGALIPTTEGDSDEDGGDTLTLNSFLPDNDRVV